MTTRDEPAQNLSQGPSKMTAGECFVASTSDFGILHDVIHATVDYSSRFAKIVTPSYVP